MIEHAVQHHTDALFMQSVTDFFEVLICSQTTVYLAVISGVVAVGIGFKDRREVNSIAAYFCNMVYPVQHFQDAVFLNAVIFKGSAAKS